MKNGLYSEYLEFLSSKGFDMGRAINPDVCVQMVDLIVKHDPTDILEIGRYKGHSMGLFKFLLPDSEVFSIDIVRHPEAVGISKLFEDCVLVDGDSDELNHIDCKFDLILIDGDHSYKGCKKDWENVKEHMADNCMVLFDDLGHARGCGKVFYEIDDQEYFKSAISIDGVEYMGIITNSKDD